MADQIQTAKIYFPKEYIDSLPSDQKNLAVLSNKILAYSDQKGWLLQDACRWISECYLKMGANQSPEDIWNASPSGDLWHIYPTYVNICIGFGMPDGKLTSDL